MYSSADPTQDFGGQAAALFKIGAGQAQALSAGLAVPHPVVGGSSTSSFRPPSAPTHPSTCPMVPDPPSPGPASSAFPLSGLPVSYFPPDAFNLDPPLVLSLLPLSSLPPVSSPTPGTSFPSSMSFPPVLPLLPKSPLLPGLSFPPGCLFHWAHPFSPCRHFPPSSSLPIQFFPPLRLATHPSSHRTRGKGETIQSILLISTAFLDLMTTMKMMTTFTDCGPGPLCPLLNNLTHPAYRSMAGHLLK